MKKILFILISFLSVTANAQIKKSVYTYPDSTQYHNNVLLVDTLEPRGFRYISRDSFGGDDALYKGTINAGDYDFTVFPAPTTGNAYIDGAPTDIKAGTQFIAEGEGSFQLFDGGPFISYTFKKGDIITVTEDAANFANAKLSVNEAKGSGKQNAIVFSNPANVDDLLEDFEDGEAYHFHVTSSTFTLIRNSGNFTQVHADGSITNSVSSPLPIPIGSQGYFSKNGTQVFVRYQTPGGAISEDNGQLLEIGTDDKVLVKNEYTLVFDNIGRTANTGGSSISGKEAGKFVVAHDQTITVRHSAFDINTTNGAGFGISTVPLDDDANGIANPDVFSSTGNRVTSVTPVKEYQVTIPKGEYYIGVFSGGTNTVNSHRLDITLSGFNNEKDNQPLYGDHTRQVFDWTPNAANVRNGYFKITDNKNSSTHLDQLSIPNNTTKEFYVFGQSYVGNTQNTQDLQIGLNILVTALDGKISFELGGDSKFLNPGTLATFSDLKYNDLVSNGGPANMKESQFNFFFRDLRIENTGFPSLAALNIRQLEVDGDVKIGDTYYNTDRKWLQTYVGNPTNDPNVWTWGVLGKGDVPNRPLFYGDVTQSNAVGPQYINVGKYTFTQSGTYTIKHNVGANTGTNAFTITTSIPTQANPTVDVVYTSEANRIIAPSSEETYTDVVLEAGVEYYFSVWSGGGSTSFDHLLEVTDCVINPSEGLITNYINSSVGAITETLPISTAIGTGLVKLFTNEDVSNTATLAVQAGETLNGVTDGTFLFSNYAAGTQFRADEVTGGWVVNVVGESQSTSSRVGEFFYAKSGSTVQGYLPVSAGTVTNGAVDYPVWAAMYPEFVSGNDIVFPANVDGMILRNLGGNAASEGTFQQDATAANGLSVNNGQGHGIKYSANTSGGTQDIGTSNNLAFWRGSTTWFPNSGGTSPGDVTDGHSITGDVETRQANRAYQLYTIVDNYNEKTLAGMVTPQKLSAASLKLKATSSQPYTFGNQNGGKGTPLFRNSDANTNQQVVSTIIKGTDLSADPETGEFTTIKGGDFELEVKLSGTDWSEDYSLGISVNGAAPTFTGFEYDGGTNKETQTFKISNVQPNSTLSLNAYSQNGATGDNYDPTFYAINDHVGIVTCRKISDLSIIMPDAVPVEDVEVVLFDGSTGGLSAASIDIGQAYTSLSAIYDKIRFEVWELPTATGTILAGSETVNAKFFDAAGKTSGIRVRVDGEGTTNANVFFNITNDNSVVSGFGENGTVIGDISLVAVRIVGIKAQKTVVNTNDLPTASQANWSDGDFGVWNSTTSRFEPATVSEVTGVSVLSTLNQLSGTTWSVNTSTSPGNLDFNWNSDFASYVQEGNKRYYSLRMYLDNDGEITFEVTGAKDVVSVQGIGSSLGSGDFANRMCFVKRDSTNTISINRDNDNDVDMFVDITFTAIMN